MAKLKPETIKNPHMQKRAGTKSKSVAMNNEKINTLRFQKKHSNKDVLGKFMVTHWFENDGCDFLDKKVNPRMSVDDHKHFIDSDYHTHFIATDADDFSIRICAKVGRRRATFGLGSEKSLARLRTFSEEIIQCKPNTGRGKKRDSINDGYAILGIHPDRNTGELVQYVFKKDVNKGKKKRLHRAAVGVIQMLEKAAKPLNPFFGKELSIMQQIVCRTNLNVIGHNATAFSIGKNYHSLCHTDDDMFYTLLTVVGPKTLQQHDVVYLFCFPSYEIIIPLRSGDCFYFNPSIPHSCSNPYQQDSYIMSAYVSKKTVMKCKPL